MKITAELEQMLAFGTFANSSNINVINNRAKQSIESTQIKPGYEISFSKSCCRTAPHNTNVIVFVIST